MQITNILRIHMINIKDMDKINKTMGIGVIMIIVIMANMGKGLLIHKK